MLVDVVIYVIYHNFECFGVGLLMLLPWNQKVRIGQSWKRLIVTHRLIAKNSSASSPVFTVVSLLVTICRFQFCPFKKQQIAYPRLVELSRNLYIGCLNHKPSQPILISASIKLWHNPRQHAMILRLSESRQSYVGSSTYKQRPFTSF